MKQMKFTLSWLKDHLDTTATVEEIAETLTDLGLEVEEVSNPAAKLQTFTLAKVLHAEQHPDADRLRVCRVMTDEGEKQIVCGAPNARANGRKCAPTTAATRAICAVGASSARATRRVTGRSASIVTTAIP